MNSPRTDPYVDPVSGVLKNRAGITHAATLQQHEAMWASAGSMRWAVKPEARSYDLDHLQRVHARLYGETYEWAGEIRITDKARNGIAHTNPQQIEIESKALFAELHAEKHALDKASPDEFAQRAGYYIGALTRLEAFREGSARTTQVFASQMARDAGYVIEWQMVDRAQIAYAQTEAMRGNNKPFEMMVRDNLKERSIEARAKDGRVDKDVIAVQAIQRNRASLDLIERSHPRDALEKHSDISTARVMLNSLEFAVHNKRKDVALSRDATAAPGKTTEFEAVPAHVSSKNALVMVKAAIYAVERSGTTVHHELSAQWQSKLNMQSGLERSR